MFTEGLQNQEMRSNQFRLSTKHVEAFAADSIVSRAKRLTLIVDITPAEARSVIPVGNLIVLASTVRCMRDIHVNTWRRLLP